MYWSLDGFPSQMVTKAAFILLFVFIEWKHNAKTGKSCLSLCVIKEISSILSLHSSADEKGAEAADPAEEEWEGECWWLRTMFDTHTVIVTRKDVYLNPPINGVESEPFCLCDVCIYVDDSGSRRSQLPNIIGMWTTENSFSKKYFLDAGFTGSDFTTTFSELDSFVQNVCVMIWNNLFWRGWIQLVIYTLIWINFGCILFNNSIWSMS